MPNAPTTSTRLGTIERLGQTVDILNYAAGTETDRGETRGTTTTVETDAVVSPPSGRRDPDQLAVADVDITAEITVPDDVPGITDGAGRLASEVDVDQDGSPEYRVVVKTDQQNGSFLLECTDVPDEGV